MGNDGFGVGFFFHQNVACLEFLAAVGRRKLVVLGLDVGIGHRIFSLKIGEQLADQDRLARQLDLRPVVVGGIQATQLRFLHEDFTRDDFIAQLALHLGRDRAASPCHLGGQRVNAGFGHGFAVDDGHVLGEGDGAQCAQHGRADQGDEKLLFHGMVLKGFQFKWEWQIRLGTGAAIQSRWQWRERPGL